MKRILSLLLILTMIVGLLPLLSFAEESDETTAQQETTPETEETTDADSAGDETNASSSTLPVEEMIPIPNDAAYYVGKSLSFAAADFLNSGFSAIQTQESADIHTDFINGAVLSVSVAGNTEFQAGSKAASNAPVIIEIYRQTAAQLPLAFSDLSNAEYPMLLKSLYESGFTNIIVDEQYDLDPVTNEGETMITMTVDGEAAFQNDVPLPVEIPITVTAHFPHSNPDDSFSAQGENGIYLPYSSEYYMRRNQNDCVQQLTELGFTNVIANAVTDVLWGSSQPEQVVGISIDGVRVFQNGDLFDANAEVVVYYHIPEFKFFVSEYKIKEGDTLTIPYYVGDGDDLTDITIKVENEDCLKQDSPYSFCGLKAGNAIVSAYYQDELLAECSVEVDPIPIESIAISDETISVGVGRTLDMPFTISPDNATRTGLEVTSSNPKIAAVELPEGETNTIHIIGMKAGNATITIQSSNKIGVKKKISVVEVLPEQITVTADTNDFYVGANGTLSAKFAPSDVTNQKITWKSSAPKVLKISGDGSYQALAAGEVTITATHPKGASGSIQIVVKPVLAKSLNLHSDWDSTKPFYRNNTMRLSAEILPENTTDKTITWTSSDESVVTVSTKGIVKAVAAGEATITATASNGIKRAFPISVAVSPQSFRVTASISMVSNDHVGNNWSTGFTFNNEPIRSGSTISIMPGETFSASGWAEDNDSNPDYGRYSETMELTSEMCRKGFTIEGDVDVRENGGRYSGHYAVWHLKMQFTPVG